MSRKNLLAFLGTDDGGRYVIVTKYLLIASKRLIWRTVMTNFINAIGRVDGLFKIVYELRAIS
jgi:hypothetical protein